jgi:catechol 2,3-dioxygenase-like lactoylglutathione lyase family enzyme
MRGRTPGTYLGFVLETPDPLALAEFYAAVTGWPIASQEPTWVTLHPGEGTTYVGFHLSAEYVPPVWPPADGRQQAMAHLDVEVTDVPGAVEDAIALGARLAEFQPQQDVRVMLDPDGHPFCLYPGS